MTTFPTSLSSLRAGGYEFQLRGALNHSQATLTARAIADGLHVVTFKLTHSSPVSPASLRLSWTHPSVDIQSTWNPVAGFFRGLRVDWGAGFLSKATSGAPVVSLHNLRGRNRLTFSFSDVLNVVELRAGLHEESAEFHCAIDLFTHPHPPVAEYKAQLLLDTRDIPYYESLRHVSDWWAALPDCTPAHVPEPARLPMYSTWYSYHQRLSSAAIEAQCRLAKQLGCEAVIVDDGWQTTDDSRGYAFCGDWEPERLTDIKEHVARVHALGLKYLLWYSVPFIGRQSKAFSRFNDKGLSYSESKQALVLDPRYPEVREYLLHTYESAVRSWDLDGLKLDFVDSFQPGKDCVHEARDGRDYASVEAAVDRLLSDVGSCLRKTNPDFMIEFRQSYVGPLMRKYGNIFRAGDCPNDGLRNRLSILDLRLLCGHTAAHSDMLMWHPDDPVESAALQLLSSLFGVPQISVALDKLSVEHLAMTRFWLQFWRRHRDLLLDGELRPLHPETFFPIVIASTATERLVAIYGEAIANPGTGLPGALFVINATRAGRIVLELEEAFVGRGEFLDCCGRRLEQKELALQPGVHSLSVPPAGLIHLRRTLR